MSWVDRMIKQHESARPKRNCFCGHTWMMHDTGWDASGCMKPDCRCRSYEEDECTCNGDHTCEAHRA